MSQDKLQEMKNMLTRIDDWEDEIQNIEKVIKSVKNHDGDFFIVSVGDNKYSPCCSVSIDQKEAIIILLRKSQRNFMKSKREVMDSLKKWRFVGDAQDQRNLRHQQNHEA